MKTPEQFVTPFIRQLVCSHIGTENFKKAPLEKWDRVAMMLPANLANFPLREKVHILKIAAEQVTKELT